MVKIKRTLSFLTAVLMMISVPLTAYASVDITDYNPASIATKSNYMGIESYSIEFDNSASALSLTGGAMTAVQWLWALILSICGVSVTDTSAIDNLAADITSWASQAGKPNIYAQLIGEILSASWGATVSHLKDMVAMVKDYFRTKTGYGTSEGISGNSIVAEIIPDDIFKWSYSMCARNGYNPSDYDLNADDYLFTNAKEEKGNDGASILYYSDYFFPKGYDENNYKLIGLFDSSSYTHFVSIYFYDVINDQVLNDIKLDSIRLKISNGVKLLSKESSRAVSVDAKIGVPNIDNLDNPTYSYPFPVIQDRNYSKSDLLKWVHDPSIYSTINWKDRIGIDGSIWNGVATKVNIPINSVPSVQQKELDTAGSLTIPADMESGQAVINNTYQAIDVDAIIAALKEYVDITYKDKIDEGEKDDTYPWVPDITGALNAIKDIIYSVKEHVSAIPESLGGISDTLTGIKDGILSIPHEITSFFTVDYAQVKTASSALQETFLLKFEPLTAITGVFKTSSGSLNSQIPVLSITVPDDLAPYCGGKEIIVFDLRGYEDYVTLFRNLVRCSIWITFAYAVLAMFKVRFGIN
jgi:hypothetical protein